MRVRTLIVSAVLLVAALPLAAALPAHAGTKVFAGVVVAKQPQRGAMLLAGARGVGLTIRGGLARAVVGERVAVQGSRQHDGTIRASRIRVLAHVRRARLRGTVLRNLARGTLVASGRSIVLIQRRSTRTTASADEHGVLRPGDVGEFRIRFDDGDPVETAAPSRVGQTGTARIEGTVVSLSPFTVAVESLPLTITLSPGTTLPPTLAVGQEIELTVQVGAGNTFTLVSIDEAEDGNPAVQAEEVEVNGVVANSTTSQITVDVNGAMSTFVAPAGTTLPVLPVGTFVEVRGLQQNGTITLTRLRVEDAGASDGGRNGSGGDDGGHGGSGGDDGGGHH